MSLITLEEYKDYSDIRAPNLDSKLQVIVDFANTYISNYCNTNFSTKTILGEIQTCLNEEYLILDNSFAQSVEEVRFYGEPLDIADYVLLKEEGVIEFRPHVKVPSGRMAIEVDYTCGLPEAPMDIRLAAMELVTHMHKREFNKSVSISGESATFGETKDIPTHIKLTLNNYRTL